MSTREPSDRTLAARDRERRAEQAAARKLAEGEGATKVRNALAAVRATRRAIIDSPDDMPEREYGALLRAEQAAHNELENAAAWLLGEVVNLAGPR